jgi:hypothetical protein
MRRDEVESKTCGCAGSMTPDDTPCKEEVATSSGGEVKSGGEGMRWAAAKREKPKELK